MKIYHPPRCKGSMLVQMVVASVISGVVMATWMSQMSTLSQMADRQNTQLSIRILKNELKNWIESEVAWSHMVNEPTNASLVCLQNSGDCRGQGGPIAIKNVLNNFVTQLSPESGFQTSGVPCNTFGQPGTCLLRIETQWLPLCESDTSCRSPFLQVSVKFISNSEQVNSTNLERFGFTILRRNSSLPIGEHLRRVGTCPAGQIMLGYKQDGTLDCGVMMTAAPTPTPVQVTTVVGTGCTQTQGSPPGFQPECACNCRPGQTNCTMVTARLVCSTRPDGSFFYSCPCPSTHVRASVVPCPQGCMTYVYQ